MLKKILFASNKYRSIHHREINVAMEMKSIILFDENKKLIKSHAEINSLQSGDEGGGNHHHNSFLLIDRKSPYQAIITMTSEKKKKNDENQKVIFHPFHLVGDCHFGQIINQ